MIFSKTKSEWLRMVDEAVDRVVGTASSYPRDSAEWDALVSEPMYLQQMRDAVLNKPPDQREEMRSRLIALSAREFLRIPEDVLEQVGVVFDVYRRYRSCSEW
jgi:hypothetical protein